MKRYLAVLTLSSPSSRIGIWALLTIAIYFAPFSWLKHLSLFGHLGWHKAPSIGLTRAYWYTLHGQFSNAWHMNKLIYLVVLIGAPLLIIDVVKLLPRAKAY